MKGIRILRTTLKYLASIILISVALGTLFFAFVAPVGGPVIQILLVPLGIWSGGLVWFLHFRQRVSMIAQRRMAVVLVAFLPIYFLVWTNVYRLETYLEHRNWLAYESEHFVFHYAPDYPRSDEITDFAAVRDAAFEQNCDYLDLILEKRIDFYVYDELAEGFAVPHWNAIFADDDQSIGHEMTHIITYHIAGERQKIKLLDEGIATWLNHSVVVTDHHCAAWEYIQENNLPDLGELAHTKTFRRQGPPQPYYPAASFVGYLIENYGLDAFRQLWTASAEYPEIFTNVEDFGWGQYFPFILGERAHFEITVREIYGHPLDDLDADWRTWLTERYGQ